MVENNIQLANKKYKPDQNILEQEKQFAKNFINETTVKLNPSTSLSQPVR